MSISIATIIMPHKIGMQHKMTVTLHENLVLDLGVVIPKGVQVTTFQTKNFGWIILPEGCKTTQGLDVPHRIWKC